MTDYMAFFKSFFENPSASGIYLAISIGLAIGFGAVWLACYRPPLFKKPWLWAVLAGSAFFTLAAGCFILLPLYDWILEALLEALYVRSRLVVAIPIVFLGGLVQQGAKMVPVVIWWRRSGKNIDPKLGLVIGAVAGAGFGILEAQWAHNAIFAQGWTWAAVQTGGFMALLGFWERFFTVAAHIAFSALAGYGLARGRGWQFYLIASALHALLNLAWYLFPSSHLVFPEGILLYSLGVSVYTAVLASLVTAWALWLRWRKTAATAETEISSP
jgi:RsiW-degrading membrane proteinase PrsW (M82 family)